MKARFQKIRVMNIYRIPLPNGELFLHIPDWSYSVKDGVFDPVQHHYHQRFRSEVNTCISNILGYNISTYTRTKDEFGNEAGEDIVWFVGAVTMREWELLEALPCPDADWTVVQAALKVIEFRTGINRTEQIRSGQHGPNYWDDENDPDENTPIPPQPRNRFIDAIDEMRRQGVTDAVIDC